MSLSWDKLIPEVVRQPDFYDDNFLDGEEKLSGWDYLIQLVAPSAIDDGEGDADDDESECVGTGRGRVARPQSPRARLLTCRRAHRRFDLEEDGGGTDEDDEWNSESFADEDEEDEDASETDEDEDADDWDTLEAKALEGESVVCVVLDALWRRRRHRRVPGCYCAAQPTSGSATSASKTRTTTAVAAAVRSGAA